jgi:Ca-activated chloride channel family protein
MEPQATGHRPEGADEQLSVRYEEAGQPADRPTAVEITFRAPEGEPDEGRRLPLNVGIAIDRSGSMAGEKLSAARRAAVGLIDALNDGERLAATAFDTEVRDVSPSRKLDDDSRHTIRRRIESLDAGATTALFDGFARAAELTALGAGAESADSWVLVLSDGMGNHGLVDPPSMRRHAAALAERGIRTITVGIGSDYQADQLTALAEGGQGDFHHASQPDEIVEIVLGELRALRTIGVRDLRIHVDPNGSPQWLLVGGDARRHGARVEARFDRVGTGRVVRAVVLFWPDAGNRNASIDATWVDRDQEHRTARVIADPGSAPRERDEQLALRAAKLWHAHIIARALELNERGEYEEAERWIRGQRRDFKAYVEGLPEASELLHTLRQVQDRVGREWGTTGHRETYVMARKARFAKFDLRENAPTSYQSALDSDKTR